MPVLDSFRQFSGNFANSWQNKIIIMFCHFFDFFWFSMYFVSWQSFFFFFFTVSVCPGMKKDIKTNMKKRHRWNKNDDEDNFFKSRYGIRRKTILEINRFFPEEFLNWPKNSRNCSSQKRVASIYFSVFFRFLCTR